MPVNKQDIINAVASRTGIPTNKARDVVNALFDIIKTALKNGEPVSIPKLGTFQARLINRNIQVELTELKASAQLSAYPDTRPPIILPNGPVPPVEIPHITNDYKPGNDIVNNIKLIFEEPTDIYLKDISYLITDLNLLYDYYILTYTGEYDNYNFTNRFYTRTGRPLKPYHQLIVTNIQKRSPIVIEFVFNIGPLDAITVIAAFSGLSVAIYNYVKTIILLKECGIDRELKEAKLKEMKEAASYNKRIEHTLIRRLLTNPIKLKGIETNNGKD